jgi:hypothetical protein
VATAATAAVAVASAPAAAAAAAVARGDSSTSSSGSSSSSSAAVRLPSAWLRGNLCTHKKRPGLLDRLVPVPVEFRWICVRPRGLVLAESPGFDGRHMQLPFLYLFIPISIKKSGNKKAAA